MFNCAGWRDGGLPRGPFVLVDGQQRISAVRGFLRNEVAVFGGRLYRDYAGDLLGLDGAYFRLHVNDLPTRADYLRWYIELNTGGTPHTESEISRVRWMLEDELKPAGAI